MTLLLRDKTVPHGRVCQSPAMGHIVAVAMQNFSVNCPVSCLSNCLVELDRFI